MNRTKKQLFKRFSGIVLSLLMIITMIPAENVGAATATENNITIEAVEGFNYSDTFAGAMNLLTSGTTWVKEDGTEAFFYHEGKTFHVTNPEIPLAKDFGETYAYAMVDDIIPGKNVLVMYDEEGKNVLLDENGKLIKNASEYRQHQHLVDDMTGTEYDSYVSYEITTEDSADIYVCDENGEQVFKLSIDNSDYYGDVYVRHFAGVFLFVDCHSYLLAACDINGKSYSAKGTFYGEGIGVYGDNDVLWIRTSTDNYYYTTEWVDGELKATTKEAYDIANPTKTYDDGGVEVEPVEGLNSLVKYEVNGTSVYFASETAIINGQMQEYTMLLDNNLDYLEEAEFGIFIHENYILVNNPNGAENSLVYKVKNLPAGKVTLDTIELKVGEVLPLTNEKLDKLISDAVVAENNGLQKLYFGDNVTIDSNYVSQTLFYEILDAETYKRVEAGYWTYAESDAFAKAYMNPETYECTYNGQKVVVVEEGESVANYNIRADKAGNTNVVIPKYVIGDSTVELVIPIKIVEKTVEEPVVKPEVKPEEKPVVKLEEEKVTETTNKIEEAIKEAEKNESSTETKPVQVVVEMKKEDGSVATEVPKEILDVAKGKNVDVVLDMGDYSWTINGKDISATNTQAINLEVDLTATNVPEDKIASVAGENKVQQLSLTHNGDFGFKASLTINLGKENEGQYGNLYYFNKDGKLEFMNAGKIDKDGKVALSFEHASDYVVVIDDKPAVPKTGDDTNVALYISLLFVGVGLVALSNKKRNAF